MKDPWEHEVVKQLRQASSVDFCESTEEKPVVSSETRYSHFKSNGTPADFLGDPRCAQCGKSNSSGEFGCPRKNKGLPLGGFLCLPVYADSRRDLEGVKALYEAGCPLEDASCVLIPVGIQLTIADALDLEYIGGKSTMGVFQERVLIFYH